MTLVDSNGGRQQSFTYSYNLRRDNVNSRTIFGFSSQAERRMKDCGPSCPYETFSKFYDYYGVADYANVWIEAAFGRTTTDFPGKGNQDFSLLGDAGIAGKYATRRERQLLRYLVCMVLVFSYH
jgi:hypothetical protein